VPAVWAATGEVANSNNTMRDTRFISKDLAQSAVSAPHAGIITLRKLQFLTLPRINRNATRPASAVAVLFFSIDW
jgi:hypothetical protein